VNVVADNAKLRDRAARIVAAISGADDGAARAALQATGGTVKPAVLIAAGARDRAHADRLLAASGGHLEPALNALRAE
jgi:N-acetylmuramic acid 6-phosphate etherase